MLLLPFTYYILSMSVCCVLYLYLTIPTLWQSKQVDLCVNFGFKSQGTFQMFPQNLSLESGSFFHFSVKSLTPVIYYSATWVTLKPKLEKVKKNLSTPQKAFFPRNGTFKQMIKKFLIFREMQLIFFYFGKWNILAPRLICFWK